MSRALSGCVHMVEAAEARRVFESAAGGVPIPDVAPRGLSVGSAPAARGGGRGLFAEAAFAPGDELLRDVLLAATVESPGASEPVVVFSRREGAWVAQYACAQELVPRVGRVAATVRMNSVHTPHGLFQAVMGRWASYVNHDCAPNAVALWTPGVGLVLRALLHIEPGEEVTRCYGRRESLPDIYGFVCACGLCTDREASARARAGARSAPRGWHEAARARGHAQPRGGGTRRRARGGARSAPRGWHEAARAGARSAPRGWHEAARARGHAQPRGGGTRRRAQVSSVLA